MNNLVGTSASEKQRVRDFYEELYADKLETGMKEPTILAEFGDPKTAAMRILLGKADSSPDILYPEYSRRHGGARFGGADFTASYGAATAPVYPFAGAADVNPAYGTAPYQPYAANGGAANPVFNAAQMPAAGAASPYANGSASMPVNIVFNAAQQPQSGAAQNPYQSGVNPVFGATQTGAVPGYKANGMPPYSAQGAPIPPIYTPAVYACPPHKKIRPLRLMFLPLPLLFLTLYLTLFISFWVVVLSVFFSATAVFLGGLFAGVSAAAIAADGGIFIYMLSVALTCTGGGLLLTMLTGALFKPSARLSGKILRSFGSVAKSFKNFVYC